MPSIAHRAAEQPSPRTTVAATIRRAGIGLHWGGAGEAVIEPALPGAGITLNGAPVGLAILGAGALATTLLTPAGPVRTVEHLLAALMGLGVDDACLTVRGGEVPILDGSAAPWVEAITPRVHGGVRRVWRLSEPVEIREAGRWIRAEPAEALALEVEVMFPGVGGGRFVAGVEDLAGFAAARTFGFVEDAPRLRAAGLALGASLENTVVFDRTGACLNPEGLRSPDEPVRHKCLDLLGDLAILGAPLLARVIASRAGHALHHRLCEAIVARGRLDPATPA